MIKEFLNLFKPYTIKSEKQYDFDIKSSDLFVIKKSGRTNGSVRGNNSKNISVDLASEEQQNDVLNFVFDTNPIKSVYFYLPIEKIVYNCEQKVKEIFSNLKFVRENKKNKYYQKYLDYSSVEKLDYARFLLTVDYINDIVKKDIMNTFKTT
jgi:hypothetical protein